MVKTGIKKGEKAFGLGRDQRFISRHLDKTLSENISPSFTDMEKEIFIRRRNKLHNNLSSKYINICNEKR